MKANAVCQHCILGNSQLVLQCALCSGKYAVKQQAEWHSRNHSYIPSEKNLYTFYFTWRKPWEVSSEMLCSSHKNCLEQPAPLVSYRHHYTPACSPFLLGSTKKPLNTPGQDDHTFFFFFFHLFLIHAGTRLTPCPLAAPLLSSWIQNSHMLGVPRQTTILYCHKAIKCLKIPFIFI